MNSIRYAGFAAVLAATTVAASAGPIVEPVIVPHVSVEPMVEPHFSAPVEEPAMRAPVDEPRYSAEPMDDDSGGPLPAMPPRVVIPPHVVAHQQAATGDVDANATDSLDEGADQPLDDNETVYAADNVQVAAAAPPRHEGSGWPVAILAGVAAMLIFLLITRSNRRR